MAKLVLIRHGESVWNTRNLFSGWVDVPLTQGGIIEATRAGRQLSAIDFDVVYTSMLVRSIQTALIVLLSCRRHRTPFMVHDGFMHRRRYRTFNHQEMRNMIPVHCCWQLNERYYGELQGFNKSKVADVFGLEKVLSWRKGFNVRPPKGESLNDTSHRTLPFFNKTIIPQLKAGKNVLVSAHANSLRSIVMSLENMDEAQLVGLDMDTANPIVYNYVDGQLVRDQLSDNEQLWK